MPVDVVRRVPDSGDEGEASGVSLLDPSEPIVAAEALA